MKMDTKRAIKLLIDHIEEISPQNVYDQIHAVESAETSRSFKHQYLHSLFEYNPEIGSQFHSLQVSDFPRGLSRWTIATLFRIWLWMRVFVWLDFLTSIVRTMIKVCWGRGGGFELWCHWLQVDLYAEFDPSYLGTFLENSQYYSLEDALSVCQKYGFVKETVFIYQRMGNNKRALELIIEELRDVSKASLIFRVF